MSAKNGCMSARKLVGLCVAAAMVVTALFASTASAKTTSYIAMGDSISFGYSQQIFEANFPAEPISAYEGGFVNGLGKKLAKFEKGNGNTLGTYNVSCPGELSDGLIGENPLLGGGGKNAEGPDSKPCAKWPFERHVKFSGSQLEEALGLHKTVDGDKFLTLQIGSNDELAVVGRCLTKTYLEYRSMTKGIFECLTVEAAPPSPKAGEEEFETDKLTGEQFYKNGMFTHIITNTGTAIGVLRSQGYTGEIGVLGFYNPQAIVLAGSDSLQKSLNFHLEQVISKKTEKAIVKEGNEEKEVFGEEKFGPGVVYANPFPKINTQKGNAKEQAAICKYTEYCNVKDKEANYIKYLEKEFKMTHAEAVAYKEAHQAEAEAFPEGDIHPSAKGHKLFTSILYKALTTNTSVNESFH